MTKLVDYNGTADQRIITAADFAAAGITHDTIMFTKEDNFFLSLPDIVAAYLVASSSEFTAQDGSTFSDIYENDATHAAPAVSSVDYSGAPSTGTVVIPRDSAAGTSALRQLGTDATDAAAGNDSRIVGAVQASSVELANSVFVKDNEGDVIGVNLPVVTLVGRGATGGPRTFDETALKDTFNLGAAVAEFTEVLLFTASATDGTATHITWLSPLLGAPGDASTMVPPGYTGGTPITTGTLTTILGAGPYAANGAILLDPSGGAYLLTSTTNLSVAWPTVDVPLARATDWVGVRGPGNSYIALDEETPARSIRRLSGDWLTPAAPHGGTFSVAAGDIVFIPLWLDHDQSIDALRVGTSVAGAAGAKVMLYLVTPSLGGGGSPSKVIRSVQIDTDVTAGDLIGTFASISTIPGPWWLGIHNHITAVTPATFHAYASTAQFKELSATAPSSADGFTGLTAAAGLTALTGTGPDSLTYTEMSEAPVIQARTN